MDALKILYDIAAAAHAEARELEHNLATNRRGPVPPDEMARSVKQSLAALALGIDHLRGDGLSANQARGLLSRVRS